MQETLSPFKVTRVVDGDTLSGEIETQLTLSIPTVGDITVDIWLPVVVRLEHVNAPEHNTDAGKTAMLFTQGWVKGETPLQLLHSEKREKYGRLLGVVQGTFGTTLNQALLDSGNAVPYEGGRR